MDNNIKFAFAVSHSNVFEAKHFGDADKYLIYAWNEQELILQKELVNELKTFDEEQNHGSKKKGNAIIKMLKENDVGILVSKQFGRNIKMVNRFFIPVIIHKETREEVVDALTKHIFWIADELENKSEFFKLFTIREGILKTAIAQKK